VVKVNFILRYNQFSKSNRRQAIHLNV